MGDYREHKLTSDALVIGYRPSLSKRRFAAEMTVGESGEEFFHILGDEEKGLALAKKHWHTAGFMNFLVEIAGITYLFLGYPGFWATLLQAFFCGLHA